MQQLNSASSACLTDLEIDEWLAGELSPLEQQRCDAHVAQCATCLARKLAIEQTSDAFYAQAPDFSSLSAQVKAQRAALVSRLGATQAARSRRRWRWLAPPLMAACAAVGFIALQPAVRAPDARETPGGSDTRSKGKPRLGFFVKRGESITRGDPGTPVFPGDALRFVYSIDRPYYLAIYSADARGVSVYFPNTPLAHPLSVGQDVALEFSVELDDTVGRERLIGLFCPEAFAVERVQSALTSTSSLPDALAGCQRVELQLNKKAHP
jgi:hypothetical protein